jgi:nicotinamidase-related amidase
MNYPNAETAALILVDMQEKLLKSIINTELIVARQKILLQAAELLNLDVIVTEQYPHGLGNTIPELRVCLTGKMPIIEKTSFSCFGEPNFSIAVNAKRRLSIAVTGVETHVCVLQTALDAISRNYQVFILEDTVSSRSLSDKNSAISLLLHQGAVITTVEAYLFMLMRGSTHPAFKSISKLIR